MGERTHLPHLALLGALTPPSGWRTDRALLSTYSADPAVLAAVLMALSGRVPEDGEPKPRALAMAITCLRGRVKIVMQQGRMSPAPSGATAAGLLDRFVHEMPWNEKLQSWHAKLAVVRFVPEDAGATGARWRFWLGSRNLTRSSAFDISLLLDGVVGQGGRTLENVSEVVLRLAECAKQEIEWRPLLEELSALLWQVPGGLTLTSLDLHLPGDPERDLPKPPDGLQRLVAVSPFLDAAMVTKVGAWGDVSCKRELLSSRPALSPLATAMPNPFAGWQTLLALASPTPPASNSDEDKPSDDDLAMLDRELHAKLIWGKHRAGHTIWLGSANLTRRGWTRNAEIVACIFVELRGRPPASTSLVEGLEAFMDQAQIVTPKELGPAVVDMEADSLDDARRDVASRLSGASQRRKGSIAYLHCGQAPHPDDPKVNLEVAPLLGHWRSWPSGELTIELGDVSSAWSDFVRLRVRLNGSEREWLQSAPRHPARDHDDDANILAQWLGPAATLETVRELLTGIADQGEESSWIENAVATRAKNGMTNGSLISAAPTLEQLLRAWQRDPTILALIAPLLGSGKSRSKDPAMAELERFRAIWKTLDKGFGMDQVGS